MKIGLEKDTVRFLYLLLLVDAIFIVLHIVHTYTNLLPELIFSIEQDRSYAEMFQYIKELWIVALLFFMAIRNMKLTYFLWACLFVYLLLDDSFRLHERLAYFVVTWFGIQPEFGLRALDIGELVVSSCIGIFFLVAIWAVYYKSSFSERRTAKRLGALVVLLAVFGVLLDMLHILIHGFGAAIVAGMIEDGGEMIVMSVITWYVFTLNSTSKEVHLAR